MKIKGQIGLTHVDLEVDIKSDVELIINTINEAERGHADSTAEECNWCNSIAIKRCPKCQELVCDYHADHIGM